MDYYGTIGPACADREILIQMKNKGMTGLRMNLSHGSLREHGDWLRLIREAGVEQLLIDLQGPELRVGELEQSLELAEGDLVRLVSESDSEKNRYILQQDSQNKASKAQNGTITWSEEQNGSCPQIPCPEAVLEALMGAEPGQELLLDDGKLLLQIKERTTDSARDRKTGAYVICQTVRGGVLHSRKSIALPGLTVNSPTLTEADHENLKIAKASGVTGVMLPFVRGRGDILTLRDTLKRYGAESIQIFAKIENLAGVRSLPEFVSDVDHVVIARGDLGNAMPLWELPGCQKRIAVICREAGTPFMVVTQMLDSMHTRAVPTRAEVSDIYNAVLDGAASVMLTGETAAGQYPVEAMKYLVKTGECALKDIAEN